MRQILVKMLKLVCIMLPLLAAGKVFADDQASIWKNIILQYFDADRSRESSNEKRPDFNGPLDPSKDVPTPLLQIKPAETEWAVKGSRYATQVQRSRDADGKVTETADVYPKLFKRKGGPEALYKNELADRNTTLRVLAVSTLFDRKDNNWVDIFPVATVKDQKSPTTIRIPGRIKSLSVWVWSPALDYELTVYLRDYTGAIHALSLGKLTFVGWRSLSVDIPASIPQAKATFPRLENLKLVKFRITTSPTERVARADNDLSVTQIPANADKAFWFYFDEISALTDIFESPYDGADFSSPLAESVLEKPVPPSSDSNGGGGGSSSSDSNAAAAPAPAAKQ